MSHSKKLNSPAIAEIVFSILPGVHRLNVDFFPLACSIDFDIRLAISKKNSLSKIFSETKIKAKKRQKLATDFEANDLESTEIG